MTNPDQINPILNDFYIQAFCPWLQSEETIKFVDLFCGAGGMSLGFERAGFEPSIAIDWEDSAIETYRYNRPNMSKENIISADIEDLLGNQRERLIEFENHNNVLVVGGPPCQGFSMANRQRIIDDPRNKLYKRFIECVDIVKPKVVVMENVRGILKAEEQILEDFKNIGFSGKCKVLNASDFGIPQRRFRAFFILFNDQLFTESQQEAFLTSIEESFDKQIQCSEAYVLKDALKGLRKLKAKTIKNNTDHEDEVSGWTVDKPIAEQQRSFLEYINASQEPSPYIFNHKARYNNDRDIEIFNRLPQGENSLHESIRDIMPYKSRDHVFKDKYFKLDENEVSKTITAHMKFDCNMYIHPTQARGLTPREAARVQTFPDMYIFKGSYTKWYQQIGNAVPPMLAYAVATAVKDSGALNE